MKKLFALVGMAALIASCTNDDFLDAGQQDNQNVDLSKGIVFSIADDAVTRGFFPEDESKDFSTSWNAETDKIGVVYLNALKGGSTSDLGKWCAVTNAATDAQVTGPVELNAGVAIYKTTKSGKEGYITSDDNDNLLTFSTVEAQKASFRVFRPAFNVETTGTGAEAATRRSVGYACEAGTFIPTMTVALGNFTTQIQATADKPNFANFFMVADPIDNVWSSDFAVGESMKLSFARPLSALVVRTNGYDESLGKLKSVKITKKTDDADQKLSSTDATVDIAKKDADGKWTVSKGSAQSDVTLMLGDADGAGVKWSDDNYAYIQVLPSAKGAYTVAAEFENAMVVVEKTGDVGEWVANGFHRITLDLNGQDIYSAKSNKLIINTGNLLTDAATFMYNGSEITVASGVTEIVANKELNEVGKSELTILKKRYTGLTKMTLKGTEDLGANLSNIAGTTVQGALTSLTLTEATAAPALNGGTFTALATLSCPKATTVPANAYKDNDVLKNVNLPVVETIGEGAFSGATKIQKINCEDATDNQLTIGTTDDQGVKTSALKSIAVNAFAGLTSLTDIDIPSQVEIAPKAFGTTCTATTILLPHYDYSASANMMNALILLNTATLKNVDLSAVSTIDGSSIGFTQSTLETVTLKEGAAITGPAFKGCTKLATVNNLDKATAIGEGAFQGTALTAATINAEAIGKNAFNGCTGLLAVTLGADVKTIGEGAFSGATKLATLNNNSGSVTTIGKEAFKTNALTDIDLMAVATIGEGAFEGSTVLTTIYSSVATLAKNVFKDAALITSCRFYNATAIEEGALQGIASGAKVVFSKELTSIDATAFTITGGPGGKGTSVDDAITGNVDVALTLNASQAGVEGNAWTFQSTDGKYYTLTFASITK